MLCCSSVLPVSVNMTFYIGILQLNNAYYIFHLYKYIRINLNKFIPNETKYKHFTIKILLTIKQHHIQHSDI